MAGYPRRGRTFSAVAIGALAAAWLVIPVASGDRAASAPLDYFAADAPAVDPFGTPAIDDGDASISAATNTALVGGNAPAVESLEAVDDVSLIGRRVEVSRGGSTYAAATVPTISEPVVVPADAEWTFSAPELTITSTLPTPTEVAVRLRGHQAEIDRCAGPVLSDYGSYGKVIGEHNHCGGAYVLEFEVGDYVRLTGYEAGDYVVTFLKDVPKKNTPVTVLSGADLFLQTCHFTGGQMRLVALAPRAVG